MRLHPSYTHQATLPLALPASPAGLPLGQQIRAAANRAGRRTEHMTLFDRSIDRLRRAHVPRSRHFSEEKSLRIKQWSYLNRFPAHFLRVPCIRICKRCCVVTCWSSVPSAGTAVTGEDANGHIVERLAGSIVPLDARSAEKGANEPGQILDPATSSR
jgi:hypothetical protein